MKPLSSEDLFAAARADRPKDDVVDQVWKRVSTTVAVPAAATAGVVGAKTGASSAMAHALAVGLVLGTAGAAFVASELGIFERDRSESSARSERVRAVVAHDETSGARLEQAAPRSRAERVETLPASAPSTRVVQAPSKRAVEDDEGSALAREARLLTAARNALLRDEPTQTLELLTTARHLPVRVLEPEERRLEARALRALGRADDAAAIELELLRGR